MTSLLVFGANLLTDTLACLFVRFVSAGCKFRAGLVSVAIVALSYLSIIYIVEESAWYIIPACAGAFVGTVITVKKRKG